MSQSSGRNAEELAMLLNVELERMKRWNPGRSVPYQTLLENVARILECETALAEGTRYLCLEVAVLDRYRKQVQLGEEQIDRPSDYIVNVAEQTVPKKEDGTLPFSFCLPRTIPDRLDARDMYGLHFLVVGNREHVPVSLGCVLDLGLRRQYRVFLYVSEIQRFSFLSAHSGSTPLLDR